MENIEYLNELQVAAEKLIHSYGFVALVTMILSWIASIAAILLIILEQTKWKVSNNMLPSLLAPYLFSSLPQVIFQFFRIGFGLWIAFLTVVLNLFLPNHFAESLKISGATILLIVVTPNVLVEAFRVDQTYPTVCITAITFLISRHMKACGGYKNSFTQKDKITYTICLWLMFIYPYWVAISNYVLFLINLEKIKTLINSL